MNEIEGNASGLRPAVAAFSHYIPLESNLPAVLWLGFVFDSGTVGIADCSVGYQSECF